MNISDLRTRIESSEKSSLLNEKAEPGEPSVLTLVDSAEPSAARKMPDPLIQALVDKLPKPNSVWSSGDRAQWLRAAAIIFNLVYKPAETDRADLKGEEEPSVLKSAG